MADRNAPGDAPGHPPIGDDARAGDVLVCLSTCPDRATALAIAHALVEARLAACVQVLPGATSVYRWQGRVEEAAEVQLVLKTTRDRLPALGARLRALHPYEVPELVALEAVAGLPDYLHWVVENTLV